MRPRKSPLIILGCALAGAVAACGSSGSSTSAASNSPSSAAASSPAASSAPASSAPASSPAPTGSAAATAIAADWTAFFSAKTPVNTRIGLLEDGPEFAALIKAQANSGAATAASAKVITVTMTSPTQATVIYDIVVSGSPVLSGQKGVSVLQGSTWKVGVSSFCGLVTLEQGGKTTGLPSACQPA
jgi:hypothetical protein